MQSYKMSLVDITNTFKFQDLVEELSNKFPFDDTFIAETPIRLEQHSHTDFESRLFISGFATFWINGEEIKCGPGTYIEIKPGVVHEFEYAGGEQLKVLRFFSDNETWQADYVN